jgi:hypothetical protein
MADRRQLRVKARHLGHSWAQHWEVKSPINLRPRWTTVANTTILALAVVSVALVSGHAGVAEVVGGAWIMWVAILAGSLFVPRVVAEPDPGKELVWDLVLVVVVLVALVGVGVIGLALP